MDDRTIVDMLFDRSETALRQISQKYQKTLFGISYNILKNHEDAEECVNDTYLGVWNAIPPARPQSLLAYVCRMVRNISLTKYHSLNAQKRNPSNTVSLEEVGDYLSDDGFGNRDFEQHELKRLFEDFLHGLRKENRYIFIRRYWYMDDVSAISKALGLSDAAVYLRIDRMKKQLKEFLKQKGVLA